MSMSEYQVSRQVEARIERVINQFILKNGLQNTQGIRDRLHDAICISPNEKIIAIHTANCEVCYP